MFVPIWLVLPRYEATNLGVFVLRHFALISPYSNGAVQIRVGLELAETVLNKGTQGLRARYGAELPPFISIVWCPGRPVILGMENSSGLEW